ncbi:MAG: hypothetical protein ACOYB1_10630 [Limnohabitans sp.]
MASIIAFALIMVFACYKFTVKSGGVELNFFLFFTLGYAYYSILPIAFFIYLESFTGVEFEIIKSNLVGVSEERVLVYSIISMLLYAIFTMGYSMPKRNSLEKPILVVPQKNVSRIFLFLAIALALLAAVPIRGDFFKGYSDEIFLGYEDGVLLGAGQRGTFVAAVSVLFICYLFHVSSQYLIGKNGCPITYYLKNKFFAIYLVFAVLMLSLGGRLYFVSHMIALLVMSNVQRSYTVSRTALISGFIGIAFIAGFYGIFRAGGELNLFGILINFMQEPLYTSISLFTYLGQNNIEALGTPILLMSDFANLLPTVFWPEKAQYIIKPEQLGYSIGMPLGGLHFFVSMCINFGYIGSLFAMLFIGYIMATINRKKIGTHSVF